MEVLKYVIEDKTIAQLLGVQNFTNDESAVLELIKNSYDAKATQVTLTFENSDLYVEDNGIGMSEQDIKKYWMHIGKSEKGYDILDSQNNSRVLAGSKGVGRFALARLGNEANVTSKKKDNSCIEWITDWNNSTLNECDTLTTEGTKIHIKKLRSKWSKNRVEKLCSFISKTYNDSVMKIIIKHPEIIVDVKKYYNEVKVGTNCLSIIKLKYSSQSYSLNISVNSDEFSEEANNYCNGINLKNFSIDANMAEELHSVPEIDLSLEELKEKLIELGDFSADLYFYIKPSSADMDKFLYKYSSVPSPIKSGVMLYRNAFGISTYEGEKDWLELGKRFRKSPAAASHPTGAWRVRENQLAGKVEIDKKENAVLQDMSNRQGLDENIYYDLFILIIHAGLKEFERYRQEIIRKINIKNIPVKRENNAPITEKILKKPEHISELSKQETTQLINEIKEFKNESISFKKERIDAEERYKYDVRILNVLATVGLKASSIAHEMENDRNSIVENCDNIINALVEYGVWQKLNSPQMTQKVYKNVPHLINLNKRVNKKIVSFMDTMLSNIEKKQFDASWQSIYDFLLKSKKEWERDYSWISINILPENDFCFYFSEDILKVIFDNMILNSIQQNDSESKLNIYINYDGSQEKIWFSYKDDGVGLAPKYRNNPRKILEVHESTRKEGHGLGMWIVNNSIIMSGGEILEIEGEKGFSINFLLGGQK